MKKGLATLGLALVFLVATMRLPDVLYLLMLVALTIAMRFAP